MKLGKLLRISIVILGVYFVSTLISSQVQISRKREELADINALCEEQRIANKDLERQLLQYEDEEYVERAVREKLGFGDVDERLYIDSSSS